MAIRNEFLALHGSLKGMTPEGTRAVLDARAKRVGVARKENELLYEFCNRIEDAEEAARNSDKPAAAEAQGLPVAGYKPTQPQWALDLVNENKVLEERILRQIDKHMSVAEIDKRWVAIARTNIEQGFMALNRAVFQPGRVTLPEDQKLAPADYKSRVRAEHEELTTKLDALKAFLGTEQFGALPAVEKGSLWSQRDLMEGYRDVLADRISRF